MESRTQAAVADSAPAVWMKADLHLHTAEDPYDEVDYTALELLDHASSLGFKVLAVTLHDKVFDHERAFARAKELGILLIQAAELRIEGADVVILNVSPGEAAEIHSFDGLRKLRALRGESLLTFAPHPFYRLGGSIGDRLLEHLDCFDAIEHCHFHVPLLNPNIQAERVARKHSIPLLATSDAHCRRFFGDNYSWLGLGQDSAANAPKIEEVFTAIRANRIRRVSPTGGMVRFFALLFFVFCIHPILVNLPGAKRVAARKARRQQAENSPPTTESDTPAPATVASTL